MINSLYIAQSGLTTSRYSVDVTSNNIANENTQGYIKRVVNTSETTDSQDDIGNGVSFDSVTRSSSDYLYDKLVSQSSLSSYYNQEDSTLSEIEIMFNETESGGLSTTLSNFFDSIESLRSNLTNSIYKNEVSTQAEMLVDNLQSLNSGLDDTFNSTIEQFEDQVDSVNNILKQIVYLNEQMIQNNTASNDLLDKRDLLEKELSNYVDIKVDRNSDTYNLKIAGVNVISNNTNFNEITINGDFSDLNNLDTSLMVYNTKLYLSSGSLKSLTQNLTTETSSISSYKQSLNEFATALVDYTTNNSTVALFSGTDVESLTFEENNLSSLTSDDLKNLAQMQWDENVTIGTTSDTSFSEFYQNLLVTISSDVENNNFKLDSQDAIVNSLETTYNNLTKVDPDQEMINLLQYQSAYEANAKVITVVDEMLQTLLAM
jgi:flagellar hook-associated protein 1 FlgK